MMRRLDSDASQEGLQGIIRTSDITGSAAQVADTTSGTTMLSVVAADGISDGATGVPRVRHLAAGLWFGI